MVDLGKLIHAKGFKKLPKVQSSAQSGHTAREKKSFSLLLYFGSIYSDALNELSRDYLIKHEVFSPCSMDVPREREISVVRRRRRIH